MKKLFSVFTLVVLFAFTALAAGEHERETLKGSGFDLVKVNDVIVGTVGDVPLWADKKCGSYIKGMFKKTNQATELAVEVVDGKLTGTFGENRILFGGVNKETRDISLNINNETVIVHFEYENFADAHYSGITFTFNIGEKDFSIRLDGKACLGSTIFYALFLYGAALI